MNMQELRALRLVVRERPAAEQEGIRIIAFTDSRVVLGAVGKGRSSAGRLNALMRTLLAYCCLKRLELKLCWISSEENVSCDPSRYVQLRRPQPANSKEVEDLIRPEETRRIKSGKALRNRGLCLEVFSGCGELSRSLAAKGLEMAPPMDAFPDKHAYEREHDLSLIHI